MLNANEKNFIIQFQFLLIILTSSEMMAEYFFSRNQNENFRKKHLKIQHSAVSYDIFYLNKKI